MAEGSKHIVYLYSEVMPYAIAVMRALVNEHGVIVDCVHWDENKRTPFVPADEAGITFHKRSTFDEASLAAFIDERRPVAMYVAGRMDKLYLKMAVLFKQKCHIVTGSDNQWTASLKQRAAAVLSGMLYKKYFEYFWVPGKRQREYAQRMGYPSDKIIPNLLTADTDVFGGVYDQNRDSKKMEYPHVMVYAGRFATEKGVDILIEAFTAAKAASANDWQLVLVGAGQMPVAKEPFITVNGFMKGAELAAACKDWGVFCLPSTYEPWGVVIHEFLMAGLPVICSDHVGASDDMVENGVNGFVFKSGDVTALMQAILQVMAKSDDELRSMGDKGYDISKKNKVRLLQRGA